MKLTSLAIIPDGNRRWAVQNFVNLSKAYFKGSQKAWQILKWILKYPQIKNVFIYLLSSENIQRQPLEKRIFKKVINAELDKALVSDFFDNASVRVKFIGDKNAFGESTCQKISFLEDKTKKNSRLTVILCIGYSGKQEIIDAVKKIAVDYVNQKIRKKDFHLNKFQKYLYFHFQSAFPQLLIRTGGECRISDFLVFQSSNSELVFVEKFWSDLTEKYFCKIIEDFMSKKMEVSDFH